MLEVADEKLDEVSGGCDAHYPDYYAAAPPCVRCAYKFREVGKACP